jgi:hypothetical protein
VHGQIFPPSGDTPPMSANDQSTLELFIGSGPALKRPAWFALG